MENEFYKQLLGSLVRHVFVIIGGVLVTRWGLTEDQVAGILNEATVSAVVGLLLVAIGVFWSYAKIKFNINFVRAARASDPGTPLQTIKARAQEKETVQTSI
jgi:hypothetical protein